jgi:hypothetical protein
MQPEASETHRAFIFFCGFVSLLIALAEFSAKSQTGYSFYVIVAPDESYIQPEKS